MSPSTAPASTEGHQRFVGVVTEVRGAPRDRAEAAVDGRRFFRDVVFHALRAFQLRLGPADGLGQTRGGLARRRQQRHARRLFADVLCGFDEKGENLDDRVRLACARTTGDDRETTPCGDQRREALPVGFVRPQQVAGKQAVESGAQPRTPDDVVGVADPGEDRCGQRLLVLPVPAQVEAAAAVENEGPAVAGSTDERALLEQFHPGAESRPLRARHEMPVFVEQQRQLRQAGEIETDVTVADATARQCSGQQNLRALLPGEVRCRPGKVNIDRTQHLRRAQVVDGGDQGSLPGASIAAHRSSTRARPGRS
jgi:hypothetical protein